MKSTPKSRSRKRDNAAAIGRAQLAVEVGFERMVAGSMWFWQTGPGQLTLLVTCVVLVGLAGGISKSL